MATGFVYYFHDLVTDAIISELPLASESFTVAMNGAGPMSGQLHPDDPRVAKLPWEQATQINRTALYAELNDVPIWGGIITTRRRNKKTGIVTLGGSEFWYYLSKRLLANVYSYVTTDPLVIAQALVNDAQAVSGGNIGIVVGTQTSTATISQDYPAGQTLTVAQAIQTLSQMGPTVGFDYAIDITKDGSGNHIKTLNWAYPRRGRASSANLVTIDGATATDYDWDEDGTGQAGKVREVGSGSGGTQLTSTAQDASVITNGWPLLEEAISRTMVTSQSVLAGVAVDDNTLKKNPILVPAITIPIGGDPPIGQFIVGDNARLILPADALLPSGFDGTKRLIKYQIMPAAAGESTMKLYFNDPPFFG